MLRYLNLGAAGFVLGAMALWVAMVVFVPETSVDDAFGFMLSGALAGAIAVPVVCWRLP